MLRTKLPAVLLKYQRARSEKPRISVHTICQLLAASLAVSEIINQVVVSGGGILSCMEQML